MQGAVFRVQGAGCRVQGTEFRVQGSGFRVRFQGSGFGVQGAGCRVQGSRCGQSALSSPRPFVLSQSEERIFVELMTSDHKLKAFREGSK